MHRLKRVLERACPVIFFPFTEGWFWVVNLENIRLEDVESAKSMLQKEDIERSLQFVFEKDQNRCVVIYALLKHFLGLILDKPEQKISFLRNAFGKPYLQDNPVHFNLSHAKTRALLGIHPMKSIGVDLEGINEGCNEDIFLYPSEKEWLKHCFKDPKEGILALWCAKEALVKAEGTGFLASLLPCFESLERGQEGIDVLRVEDKTVYVYHEILKDYKIAVSII